MGRLFLTAARAVLILGVLIIYLGVWAPVSASAETVTPSPGSASLTPTPGSAPLTPSPPSCGVAPTPTPTGGQAQDAGTQNQPKPSAQPCEVEPKIWLSGIVFVAGLWLIYVFARKNPTADFWAVLNPARLFEGKDGRASTSKFQFVAWTTTLFWAYLAIFYARWLHGNDPHFYSNIPPNLLLATGLSAATAIAARGITGSQVANNQVQKSQTTDQTPANNPVPSRGLAALFEDDDGVADIGKFQLVGWTTIGIATFAINVLNAIRFAGLPDLPDLDPALMVLMGLGHGAYLGKKLVTADTPKLTGLTTVFATGSARPKVTIIGNAFGDSQSGSLITFDRSPIPVSIAQSDWTDSRITFELPATQSSGARWVDAQVVAVGVTVSGGDSANTLPLAFTSVLIAQLIGQATIDSVTADSGSRTLPMGITIKGNRFGAQKGSSVVTVDGQELLDPKVGTWTDNEIKFILPTANGPTNLNNPGATLVIGVIVAGRPDSYSSPDSKKFTVHT